MPPKVVFWPFGNLRYGTKFRERRDLAFVLLLAPCVHLFAAIFWVFMGAFDGKKNIATLFFRFSVFFVIFNALDVLCIFIKTKQKRRFIALENRCSNV